MYSCVKIIKYTSHKIIILTNPDKNYSKITIINKNISHIKYQKYI